VKRAWLIILAGILGLVFPNKGEVVELVNREHSSAVEEHNESATVDECL
jgi:hypothetical protein